MAETAARHLKATVLELGGKAPMLVLDDADLDEAVRAAAFGAFLNQGQICMSTERIVVDAVVADAFAARLARYAMTLVASDSRKGQTPLGSLVGREAADRILGLVRDAVAKGATLLCGGHANGTFMDATVLDHVAPNMAIYTEESFGPVVALVRGAWGRRSRPGRQRHRLRTLVRGIRTGRRAGHRGRAAHRVRHLPRQWRDRA